MGGRWGRRPCSQCQGVEWVSPGAGACPVVSTYLELRDLGLRRLREDFSLSFDETFLKPHEEDASYSLQHQNRHQKGGEGKAGG